MLYHTFESTAALHDFVKCYWVLESPASGIHEKQRIVPDGCMEMIFHFGDLYRQYKSDGSSIIQPRCFVFGQITTPLDIAPTGASGIFAVRFHPDGFLPFATIPLQQMADTAVPLTTLFGEDGDALEYAILNAQTHEQRIEIVNNFLEKRLNSEETIDRVVKVSIATILGENGQLSIDDLAGQLNVNRRQLERKFATVIGLSPKQLSKIIRLQATIKLLQSQAFDNLTALAYENAYYDQAHFIRDFKEFTGVSPKQFYAGNLTMSSLFSGTK